MQIKPLPEFTAGARMRAQTALDIILINPAEIDSRKYDRCFEMYDGKDVALLIMHTFKSNNITFNQLPPRVQRYWGLSWWNRLEKEYTDLIQTQLTLSLF